MFHIICGTYETPLYGYKAHLGTSEDADNIPPNKPEHEEPVLGGVILEQLFAYSPHNGAIKSVVASGEWLVTSSTDESLKCVATNNFPTIPPVLKHPIHILACQIVVYDMTSRRELGTITRSEGVITCLEFHKDTYLFCGTERGDVLVWKTHHWEQMATLKGHTGRINNISVHPSGVLALSTSQDKTLKLWDLSTGKVAHTNKLEYEADVVKWAPDGQHYIVTSDKRIILYSAQGKKLRTMQETKRIIAVTWIDNANFSTGGEDRTMFIWNIHSDDPVLKILGFQNRVKGISTMAKLPKQGKDSKYPYLVTISSDERIRVWDPDQSLDTPVCSLYNDVRLISLTVAPIPTDDSTSISPKDKKRKKPTAGEDDDAELNGNPTKKPKFVVQVESNAPKVKKQVVETKATKPDGTTLKSILKKSTPANESQGKPKAKFAAPKEELHVPITSKSNKSQPKSQLPPLGKAYAAKKQSLGSLLFGKK